MIEFLIAFGAGLISFLSPCVLPLIPGYISYISGSSLNELIEKQKVLYTRLSLSDDPQAKVMKESIIESARQMGFPSNIDMNIMFSQMYKMVEMMKTQLDRS